MKAGPLKAIVFDAVGTLIHPDPPVAVAYGTIARRFGCDLPADEIELRFRRAFQTQERLDGEHFGNRTSEDREHQRWRSIVAAVFEDIADGQGLFAALWEHFGRPENWRVFDDVLPAWMSLERQGVRLAIGSNFDSRLLRVCPGLPPLDRAEHVFVSSRIGWRKPAAQFFTHAAGELGLTPAEIALVGDDVVNDFGAAQAAGWRAALLDRTSGSAIADALQRLAEWKSSPGQRAVG